MARLGKCTTSIRLPLTPLAEHNQAILEQVMQSAGLL
jgi:dihydrodipicolinate synthase/N-acetylneuraminate lyase